MTRPAALASTYMLFAVTTAFYGTTLVHAGSPPRTVETPPVKVSFSDLNANTPAGAKVLYGRIKTAADRVCGPNVALWYPGKASAARECSKATVDNSVKQINRPALTALHEHAVNLASR